MNYFKKMLSIRKQNSDGWSANYGAAKGGYGYSNRFKELINRDRRAKKKWVKNHEAKMLKRDEDSYYIDSSSDLIEFLTPEKDEFFAKHYYHEDI